MPFTPKELDSLKKAIREAIQKRKYIALIGGDYLDRFSLADIVAEENFEIEKNFIESEARNFKKLLRYEKETDREYLESELEHELSCGFTYMGERFETPPLYKKYTEEELYNSLIGHTVEGVWEDGILETLLSSRYTYNSRAPAGHRSNLDRFLSSNEADLCATLYIDGLRSDVGKNSLAFRAAADIVRYYQAMRNGELAELSLISPKESLRCTRLLVIGLSSEDSQNIPQCFIDQFEVIELPSKGQNKNNRGPKTQAEQGEKQVIKAIPLDTTLILDLDTKKFSFGGVEQEGTLFREPRARVKSIAEKFMKHWKKKEPCPKNKITPHNKIPQGVRNDISKIRCALKKINVTMQVTGEGYPPPEEPTDFATRRTRLE